MEDLTLGYVFQNFVWVPIVSAVIGFFLGLLVPKIHSRCLQWWNTKISQKIEELSISGEWNSFFREERNLYTEKVKLTQNGREITGTISMAQKRINRVYNFSGTFKNQILVGTYESANRKKDERGSIVLRYVNENLLSGYCTFIYKNKQVYNSPYILTSTGYHLVDRGTYQFCNTCVGRFNCCCNCEEIDMPILLPSELTEIARLTKKNIDEFAKKLSEHLYQMKRTDDDEKKGCIFFINNKCSVYDNRPIDCRLFPFDFKEIDGEYWVIYYDNVCQAIPTDRDEIDVCAHNMRPLLELIMPYMSECSDPKFSQRLTKQHYEKLFKVDEIVGDKNN